MTTMTLYGGPLDGAERPVCPYGITYCEAVFGGLDWPVLQYVYYDISADRLRGQYLRTDLYGVE